MIVRWLRMRWPYLVGPVVILGVWELLSRTEIISSTFYPPPSQIVARIFEIVTTGGELVADFAVTGGRLLATAALAAVLGTSLGLVMAAVPLVSRGLENVLSSVYPVPTILFFPLITFVVTGQETAIIITALVTPMIIMALYTLFGVRQIEQVLLEVAHNYGARGPARFWRLLLPGALGPITAGLRLALGYSLITVVAVEMLGAQSGLGAVLWESWSILRVTDMYVALFGVAVLGLLSSIGYDAVLGKLMPWRAEAGDRR